MGRVVGVCLCSRHARRGLSCQPGAVSSWLFSPLAASVRQVLSGTDDGQSRVVARIEEPAGAPGWFRPGDAIWTVHGSVSTFLGGIRSLLLQTLHPLALAGVTRHSNYREDPFGRLQRTGAFIAATTYGPSELAEQTIGGIAAMHAAVRGQVDGRAYSAQDPRLLEWVHVALVDSMLTAYLEYGHDGKIDPDQYVSEMAVVGRAMGVTDPPVSLIDLRGRIAGFRPELRGGSEADQMKSFIMDAPLPLALQPGYGVLARAAQDTLPDWAVHLLGGSPAPTPVRRARAVVADSALRTLSFALVRSPAQAAGERRLAVGMETVQ